MLTLTPVLLKEPPLEIKSVGTQTEDHSPLSIYLNPMPGDPLYNNTNITLS